MLLEIDVTTGVLRMPIAEPTNGFLKLGAELYKQPNSRIIAGGSQAIWYSERSGFGHLYLYDLTTAALLTPITAGDWPVRDGLDVDAEKGRHIFKASGPDPGHPYQRRVPPVEIPRHKLHILH